VLFGLNQDQLSSTIFPLGGLLKSEVRQISKKLKLKTAEKKESQEICFIWDNDYPKFLRNKYGLNPLPGEIIDKKGKVLGRHLGVINFTIGQRRGLGLGGSKEPLYVTGINVSNNRLTVGGLEDLKKDTLFADRINWVSIEKPNKPIRIKAKIRYNHMPGAATVKPTSGNKAEVIFDKPQSAITPGQAIVFYKSDIVLGGGWISS
jgi:tRNA-specific 2-thiouridylase